VQEQSSQSVVFDEVWEDREAAAPARTASGGQDGTGLMWQQAPRTK